jgi:hypothetical protein
MKKRLWAGLGILTLLVLVSCAPDPNPMVGTQPEVGTVANFWMGLWHGFITPVTFIISLFSDSVGVYDVHNNGSWYNFGYVLGLMIIFGGSGNGAGRSVCKE